MIPSAALQPPTKSGTLSQKFAQQLERQLSKDGLSSVHKTEKSLQKPVTEHKAKLADPNLQYKSAIVKQLAKQERQLQTVKEFLTDIPKD
ncbi:MAG: hypothetical protein LAN64_07315 [Acidobacteriia bacterium]|nr:hypothetical protein [Terriglobia bacterium]